MDSVLHLTQVLLFWLLALALLAWPLWPAWREWRRPTDLNPLPVVRVHSGDARAFAQRFERWMHEHAQAAIDRASSTGDNSQVLPMGRQSMRVLGRPQYWLTQHAGLVLDEGLLSALSLDVPADTICQWELGSQADVRLGVNTRVRAVAASGNIHLDKGARLLRWADAGRAVHAATGALLEGRVTAGQALTLAPGVTFSRLSAPVIAVGVGDASVADALPASPVVPTVPAWQPDRGEAIDDQGRTWRYPGRLSLPAGTVVAHKLIVEGDLHLGAGAIVQADLKVNGDLVAEQGVQFLGAVVATRNLQFGPHGRAAGPVVAEERVQLAEGVCIGAAGVLTTVAAATIDMATGVRVHGSIWARDHGRTVAA